MSDEPTSQGQEAAAAHTPTPMPGMIINDLYAGGGQSMIINDLTGAGGSGLTEPLSIGQGASVRQAGPVPARGGRAFDMSQEMARPAAAGTPGIVNDLPPRSNRPPAQAQQAPSAPQKLAAGIINDLPGMENRGPGPGDPSPSRRDPKSSGAAGDERASPQQGTMPMPGIINDVASTPQPRPTAQTQQPSPPRPRPTADEVLARLQAGPAATQRLDPPAPAAREPKSHTRLDNPPPRPGEGVAPRDPRTGIPLQDPPVRYQTREAPAPEPGPTALVAPDTSADVRPERPLPTRLEPRPAAPGVVAPNVPNSAPPSTRRVPKTSVAEPEKAVARPSRSVPSVDAVPIPVEPGRERVRKPLGQVPEETDVWWGSYSGWSVLPGLTVVTALTAGTIIAAREFVDNDVRTFAVVGACGALWSVLLTQWVYRVLCYHYRLTTRRLMVDRGWLYAGLTQVELTDIARVVPRGGLWAVFLGCGKIMLELQDEKKGALVLEGVRRPVTVAKRIDDLRKQHPAA